MKYQLNDRPVEVEAIDRNKDGSKYITKAGYIDGKQEELTHHELDDLQNLYEDCEELNASWG